MNNYFKLIDPYLYGRLSPEEQLVFERQIARNPALANELSVRFSLVRVLLANPAYPFHSGLRALQARKQEGKRRASMFEWFWLACSAAVTAGLIMGYLLP
ncbi:MAG: hypothetical protein KDC61_02105 [Saprospiraceae bacterium]|nr:hypothetical protein [Saprospiraceae bacterium]MCB0543754.1 hypothetical protein [Saprospiraceae bacterium]MCB0573343.1 hypothetical protein [Saprospiraceae bacterium]MCB9306080.1 hypothetical protein [Lewinellaceae bacterium]MCB9356228.1 hypothetical protein [Lewinellaceae bacterium]